MFRVCVIVCGILAVGCWASPAGSRSDEGPTPIRYTYRVETIEFGPDALVHEIHHHHPYEHGEDSEGDAYYIHDESCEDDDDDDDVGESSAEELVDDFHDLDFCEMGPDGPLNPDDRCVYFDHDGNVHMLHLVDEDEDVDAVYAGFKEVFDLEKCEDDVSRRQGESDEWPMDGCVFIDDEGSVHFIGAFTYILDDVDDEISPLIVDEDGDLFIIDDDGNIHVLPNEDDQQEEQQEDQQQELDQQELDQQEEQQQQQEDQQQQQQQQEDQQQQQQQQQQETQQQQGGGGRFNNKSRHLSKTQDDLSRRAAVLVKKAMEAVEKKASEQKENSHAQKRPNQQSVHKKGHHQGRQANRHGI